nr:nucleotidyltransferase family protein [Nodosilinea sp. LEGE 07088]
MQDWRTVYSIGKVELETPRRLIMSPSVSRDNILGKIRAHRLTLEAMGVKSLGLFGSVARNEATAESDIDVLVEFSQPVGFFQVFDIQYFLEDLLQCPIDLGTVDSLKEHLRTPVLEDIIHVF